MSVRASQCAVAILALAIPSAWAQAASDDAVVMKRERYEMIWLVADPLDGGGETGRTVQIKSGDMFMRHRLLPPKAARLNADMIDAQGKVVIAKGTEMFSLGAGGLIVFCEAGPKDPSALKSLLVAGGYAHDCGIDRDGDGAFESHFKARGVVKGLPSLSGKIPKQPASVTRSGYELIAPTALATTYFVGIEYEGKPLLYNRRNFRISFGNGNKQQSLSDWSYVSGASYPQSLGLLGGRFTILSEANGALTVRIDRDLPPQPFGIVQTVKYSFY